MAGKLKSLIRLNEWKVDEKRLKLGSLLRALEKLEGQLSNLESTLKKEQALAAESPDEAGFLYGRYARSVIENRRRLRTAVIDSEKEIVAAREELGEAYLELKKFETAEAEHDRLEAEERARKDQAVIDEVGLQAFMHRRR